MSIDFKRLRIVFMGTPEFAVAGLQKLVEAGCTIAGVVTAPDKPAGRGMQLQQSAVKQYAVSQGLHILQPDKLKNPEFIEQLQSLQADLFVVVAFRMLPEIVWNMPPMGTINVHGSLLPQYRGAAPINWAIINGEKQTGVTTFKLKHEIDTGNILRSKKISIEEVDNAGTLHDKMKLAGADLLLETIQCLADGRLTEQSQDDLTGQQLDLKHAPKIFAETCNIDWSKSCSDIHNLIRGLSPYPGAFTQLEGKKIKIFVSSYEEQNIHAMPGSFNTDHKTFLRFASTNGYIYAKDVQIEGKKRMPVVDFLRGYRFS